MLAPFGPLAAFNLVMDRATGNSKARARRRARSAARAPIQLRSSPSIAPAPSPTLHPPAPPSQGYAFAEYADVAATDAAVSALNGRPVGTKFMTVKRALAPAGF